MLQMSCFIWLKRTDLVLKGTKGERRKVLVFEVFLCTCCVAYSALLFMDVFPVIVSSFGVATRVTTCPYLLCMMALVATSSIRLGSCVLKLTGFLSKCIQMVFCNSSFNMIV